MRAYVCIDTITNDTRLEAPNMLCIFSLIQSELSRVKETILMFLVMLNAKVINI